MTGAVTTGTILDSLGASEVSAGRDRLELAPQTAGFYVQGRSRLQGVRRGGERHRFVTVEFSPNFIARHLTVGEPGLHPGLRNIFKKNPAASVSEPSRLTSDLRELVRVLQHPPANCAARRLWSHGKALEVASSLFFPPAAAGDLRPVRDAA